MTSPQPRSARLVLLSTALLFGLAFASSAQAAPAYAFTDITLGSYPDITDINNAGQVVGSAYVEVSSAQGPRTEHRGFLYTQGQFQVLGSLGVATDAYGTPSSYSAARAINIAGQVVGTSDTATTVYDSRGHAYGRAPFSWAQGQMSALPNAAGFTPLAINAQGRMAGMVGEIDNYAGSDSRVASIYAAGQLTQLNQLGLGSAASGINDQNQVVGTYSIDRFNYVTHAFLYENGQVHDLGTLGGTSSSGSAINAAGQIAGSSQLSGSDKFHAIRYSGGALQDLGTIGGFDNSLGRDINAQGVVVGAAYSGYDLEAAHAFVYSGGAMLDLNSLVDAQARQGWLLTDAVGINDQGIIVGHAVAGGQRRLFMLTPVPEAQSWAMALAGLLTVGGILRARRQRTPE